jgi:GNAT superfamily N-acetyltransferase
MQVRKASLNDAETIAHHNLLLAKESENQTLSPKTVLKGVRSLLSDETKGFYLVAVDENMIIGQVMITFEWSDWRNQMIWWIQSVYVQKDHRHKGVFTQLIEEVKKQAKKENIDVLRLYVFSENSQAIKVYQKQNWKKEPYYIFQKEIDST